MEYSVNMRKLKTAFNEQFLDLYKHDRIDKENMQYLFYRLVYENGSFKRLILTFNSLENTYLMSVSETTAFMLALMEVLGIKDADEFDDDIVFEIEIMNWRKS